MYPWPLSARAARWAMAGPVEPVANCLRGGEGIGACNEGLVLLMAVLSWCWVETAEEEVVLSLGRLVIGVAPMEDGIAFEEELEEEGRVGLKIGMQDFGEASRPRSRGDRERRRDVTIPALFGRGRCRRRRRVWDVAMEEGFLEAVDGVMNLPVCKWFIPIVAVDMPKAAAR